MNRHENLLLPLRGSEFLAQAFKPLDNARIQPALASENRSLLEKEIQRLKQLQTEGKIRNLSDAEVQKIAASMVGLKISESRPARNGNSNGRSIIKSSSSPTIVAEQKPSPLLREYTCDQKDTSNQSKNAGEIGEIHQEEKIKKPSPPRAELKTSDDIYAYVESYFDWFGFSRREADVIRKCLLYSAIPYPRLYKLLKEDNKGNINALFTAKSKIEQALEACGLFPTNLYQTQIGPVPTARDFLGKKYITDDEALEVKSKTELKGPLRMDRYFMIQS